MRAFISGQVGVDKTPFLEAVKDRACARGLDLEICHVGKMMYEEAPDVPAGRILNLPITRLNALLAPSSAKFTRSRKSTSI